MVLMGSFTVVSISAERHSFRTLQSALSNKEARPVLTALLEKSLNEFDSGFVKILLFLNFIMLVFASVASYFLSAVTLKPIQEMFIKQEEFSADASHELRTPITTMNIEIEALIRTKIDMSDDIKQTFFNIQSELSRMKDIVDGLLVLVRPPSPEMLEFDLTSALNLCSKKFKLLTELKNINFSSDITPHLKMPGVKDSIIQSVMILLDNAVKYTQNEGSILLSAVKQGGKTIILVKDSGIGIDKNEQNNVFKRFYRINRFDQKGLGLGLSIVKKLAHENNGKIKLDSERGKGTSVYLIFPS